MRSCGLASRINWAGCIKMMVSTCFLDLLLVFENERLALVLYIYIYYLVVVSMSPFRQSLPWCFLGGSETKTAVVQCRIQSTCLANAEYIVDVNQLPSPAKAVSELFPQAVLLLCLWGTASTWIAESFQSLLQKESLWPAQWMGIE